MRELLAPLPLKVMGGVRAVEETVRVLTPEEALKVMGMGEEMMFTVLVPAPRLRVMFLSWPESNWTDWPLRVSLIPGLPLMSVRVEMVTESSVDLSWSPWRARV